MPPKTFYCPGWGWGEGWKLKQPLFIPISISTESHTKILSETLGHFTWMRAWLCLGETFFLSIPCLLSSPNICNLISSEITEIEPQIHPDILYLSSQILKFSGVTVICIKMKENLCSNKYENFPFFVRRLCLYFGSPLCHLTL